MVKTTVVREIAAPREKVFEAFADLRNAAERIRGIESLEVLTEGPIGLGTRWRETRIMFKKKATEEMEFTAFDPPQGYVVEAASHGAKYRSEFRFLSTGPDSTRVEMDFEATPVSFFAKMTAPLGKLMMGSIEKLLGADMEDIKAHLEGKQVTA